MHPTNTTPTTMTAPKVDAPVVKKQSKQLDKPDAKIGGTSSSNRNSNSRCKKIIKKKDNKKENKIKNKFGFTAINATMGSNLQGSQTNMVLVVK